MSVRLPIKQVVLEGQTLSYSLTGLAMSEMAVYCYSNHSTDICYHFFLKELRVQLYNIYFIPKKANIKKKKKAPPTFEIGTLYLKTWQMKLAWKIVVWKLIVAKLFTSSSLDWAQGKENVNPTGSFLSLIFCFSMKSPRQSATWSKSCRQNRDNTL